MIVALLRIIGDLIGPFLGWAKLPLGRVFGSKCDFAQDEVSYVKSSELHSLVVVLSHLLQLPHHLIGCFVFDFIQAVQVDSEMIIIAVFMENFSSHAGDYHFDWDYCFGAIGESERGFSCRDSCYSPVCHRTLGNSSGQAPLASSNRALMILSSV